MKTLYYYSAKGNETCFYEIKKYPNNTFRTSVSIDNSEYQFVNYFKDYVKALNHVYKHQFKTQEYL